MKSALHLLLILTIIHHAVCAPDSNKYSTRYDNIDVNAILKSDRLLRHYFNCLMDRGPCTREGLELKSELLIQGLCSVCNVFHLGLIITCMYAQSSYSYVSIHLCPTVFFFCCLSEAVVRNFELHVHKFHIISAVHFDNNS
jgi:hypothetical protein